MADPDGAAERIRRLTRMLWEKPAWRAGAGLIGAATVVIFFQFAWVSPQQARLTMQQQELDQVRAAQTAASRAEERFTEVTAQIADLVQELDRLVAAYPSERQAPILLRQLHLIAEQSALTLLAYAPQPPEAIPSDETGTNWTRWSVQLELAGRFHDFVGFLDRVGQLPQVIRLGDLVVRGGDPAGPDGTIRASVTAETLAVPSADGSARLSRQQGATAVDVPMPAPPVSLTYDPAGRRDPFMPPLAAAASVVPDEPHAGLRGVAANELSLHGLFVVAGATAAVLESPGGRSWLVRGGERLLDGVIGSIGADVVHIRPVAGEAAADVATQLRFGAPPEGMLVETAKGGAEAGRDNPEPGDAPGDGTRDAPAREEDGACGE